MSSGYFSRHGDTIHCGQQWLQTGTRGLGGYKGPHSKRRSISRTLHARSEKRTKKSARDREHTHTHPHTEAWRSAAVHDKVRGGHGKVQRADRSPRPPSFPSVDLDIQTEPPSFRSSLCLVILHENKCMILSNAAFWLLDLTKGCKEQN